MVIANENASIIFEDFFKTDFLEEIYNNHIIHSYAIGIDNISHKKFNKNETLHQISGKVTGGSYFFTKYKLKLISKGRGKPPREISIPTIRDRTTLKALCKYLQHMYSSEISTPLPQNLISDLKTQILLKKYEKFIKLDLSNFYPSVNQEKLIQILKNDKIDQRAISLVEKAIKNPTTDKPSAYDKKNTHGIPQGLSISNILATIYIKRVDSLMKSINDISYFRYVDDILILCKSEKAQTQSLQKIICELEALNLTVHNPLEQSPNGKSKIGLLSTDSFDYLGYQIQDQRISVREASINKLKSSLVNTFVSHKHSSYKNLDFLIWRLNLRITGCILDETCKGWLFFFSEINDEQILHQLDFFIEQLCKRFETNIKPKKFVRSFYLINHKKHVNRYIVNYDNFTIDQKIDLLTRVFKKDCAKMSVEEIDWEFNGKIRYHIKDLLEDIKNMGSG